MARPSCVLFISSILYPNIFTSVSNDLLTTVPRWYPKRCILLTLLMNFSDLFATVFFGILITFYTLLLMTSMFSMNEIQESQVYYMNHDLQCG